MIQWERIRLPMQETQETWVRVLGSGGSPGEGNGNLLQYSYLENSGDRGDWWTTVYGVTKSWTRLSIHTHIKKLVSVYYYITNISILVKKFIFGSTSGGSVVRICLLMQNIRVWSLIQEDPMCLGAAKPMPHNDWAWELQLTTEAHMPKSLRFPVRVAATMRSLCTKSKRSPHLPQLKTIHKQQWRSSIVKNTLIFKKKFIFGLTT